VLEGINLVIHPGEWIGVVGSTGSGKSTLLDLLMGLLSPTNGEIRVDGILLEERNGQIDRRQSWQRHLAHVPQSIFLADASIAENIAFGMAPVEIDRDRLSWAAASAQAEEFISKLPEGFNTPVGERGVRLSGGQRQRLGLARALYKQADVLVLDEATSALDSITENTISLAIQKMRGDTTILMAAHRLSTVRQADQVIYIKDGLILHKGIFEEVRRFVPDFEEQARLMGL
jgi:ATP-binding cassette subfamily B protein